MSSRVWLLSIQRGREWQVIAAYTTLSGAQTASRMLDVPEGTGWSIQSMSLDVWHPAIPGFNPSPTPGPTP